MSQRLFWSGGPGFKHSLSDGESGLALAEASYNSRLRTLCRLFYHSFMWDVKLLVSRDVWSSFDDPLLELVLNDGVVLGVETIST